MADEETDDVDVRHRFTNDTIAVVLVVSNVGLLVVSLLAGVAVPSLLWQTFALAVALATTWAFGKGTLKTVLGAVQNNGDGGG